MVAWRAWKVKVPRRFPGVSPGSTVEQMSIASTNSGPEGVRPNHDVEVNVMIVTHLTFPQNGVFAHSLTKGCWPRIFYASAINIVASLGLPCFSWRVKLFYTGPVINTEMLVAMLEKHGIAATQEFVDPGQPDDGDLNRLAKVFVPETDYDRAHQLFYADREDEL